MTGAVDLVREHRSALMGTPFEAPRRLAEAGVSWRAIATVAPASMMIRVDGDLFQPDPDGRAAFVIPVRVHSALSPEARAPLEAVAQGEIVDLLAFHPAKPDRWALRRGTAEWLGAIPPQFCAPDPVRVWRSPMAWLIAGCHGMLPLSRNAADIHRLLAGCL